MSKGLIGGLIAGVAAAGLAVVFLRNSGPIQTAPAPTVAPPRNPGSNTGQSTISSIAGTVTALATTATTIAGLFSN